MNHQDHDHHAVAEYRTDFQVPEASIEKPFQIQRGEKRLEDNQTGK